MDEIEKELCQEAFPQLDSRTREALWRGGLHRWREVEARDDDYLMALPGIDEVRVQRIRDVQAYREAKRARAHE